MNAGRSSFRGEPTAGRWAAWDTRYGAAPAQPVERPGGPVIPFTMPCAYVTSAAFWLGERFSDAIDL